MSIARRLMPHPVISALLLVVWLVLHYTVAAGHVVLGAALAVLIPLFTERFFPEPVYIGRIGAVVKLLSVVLWDIVVATFAVLRLTLGPTSSLRPSFVRVPVELGDDFALTTLASTISLTPGTVTAEISPDREHILVHALDVADDTELVRLIKTRYEAPIKEIFKC